jgi:hypothetical protein
MLLLVFGDELVVFLEDQDVIGARRAAAFDFASIHQAGALVQTEHEPVLFQTELAQQSHGRAHLDLHRHMLEVFLELWRQLAQRSARPVRRSVLCSREMPWHNPRPV